MHETTDNWPPPFARPVSDLAQRTGFVSEPPAIAEAFEFVALCHRVSGPMACLVEGTDGERRMDLREREMHPALEGAYRNACRFITLYFDDACREYVPDDDGNDP